jgi:hypothetical protein
MPLALTAPRASGRAAEYLDSCRDAVVEAAEAELTVRSPRYAGAPAAVLHERLTVLYSRLVESLEQCTLVPLLDHASAVAAERFHGGYDLSEVQKAYNALEEAIWSRVLAEGTPEHYAVVLPWVSAAIGAAKDELARRYVLLAAGAHAPAVDVAALFRGGGRA